MKRYAFLEGATAIALSSHNAVGAVDAQFPAQVVRADLDFVIKAIDDVGVQPFRTSNRAEVERRYLAVRAALVGNVTIRSAWLKFASVLAALNDGHVGLDFPAPLNAAWRRFPIRFALADNGFTPLVESDGTNTIPIGARLVAIDEISSDRYSTAVRASFGGQTRALELSRFTYSGREASVALLGDHKTYRVHYIDDGARREAYVSQAPSLASVARTASQAYTYRRIGSDIAFIDYKRCEDLAAFERFLSTTFADIATRPTRALIVDIRNNGGGDSELNDALWSYVATRPFRQFSAILFKSCDRIKRAYGRKVYVDTYSDAAWHSVDGTMFREVVPFVDPPRREHHFDGKTYLLTSTQTFSSAMSCALAAKDYDLATVVGEETGEPANSTGEVFAVVCPNTGLSANLTTKIFLAPKPHSDRQGVVPDVFVSTTLADIAANHDPVLAQALVLARA